MSTDTLPPTLPGTRGSRLLAFLGERAPNKIYLTYAVVWVVALQAAVALLDPARGPWVVGTHTVVEMALVWLALVFIRVVDEQKDLEYDRVHNPDRPLPRGAIGVADLRVAMAAITVLGGGLALWRSPALAGLFLVVLAYVLFLVLLERVSPRFRDSTFTNLWVSYFVQVIIGTHILLAYLEASGLAFQARLLLPLLLCAGVFLHFEFARKTRREVVPGAQFYSNLLGFRGSAWVAAGFPLAAALLLLVLVRPWEVSGVAAFGAWLPLAPLGLVWRGAEELVALRRPGWPPGPAMGYLAWTYVLTAVAAAAVLDVRFLA
ncbi:4-hydroxybenzoate polyprenyltransferase [Crossiella equi]|uniref:4-hydroxybenzoate polyprenyltransferase n=1 Tax=Crossiella equi TaxID=130796 RepID=A0ABS5ATY2_9PSEU|nr:hypothetical protein [Crossiella equi]MBP2479155.1 4-hydroxybenzoate polyprenyltransferase [Crossiella equi]